MNCNTTHYRANSSSVPGDPTAEAIRSVEARRPGPKAEFSDRLMFALLLQEMGATQEARDLWASLSQERTDLPELSALAK